MNTVNDLLAALRLSGRPVTRRALRDWWTKGLLPRPTRRSLGRGKGFVTGWDSRTIVAQAAAVHELLKRHGRTEPALLRLWLFGFNVPFPMLRRAWLAAIGKDERALRAGGKPDEAPEDAVGRLAAMVARGKAQEPGSRDAVVAALYEGLSVFYGTGEAIERQDLGPAFAEAMRHLQPALHGSSPYEWTDDKAASMLQILEEWVSLPAQREVIRSATHHELTRARRLMQIGLGTFQRPREDFGAGQQWPAAIVFGRGAIPVLVKLLREPYAARAVDVALNLSREMRKRSQAEKASLP